MPESLRLLGLLILVIGLLLRLRPTLVVVAAAVVTGLLAGMPIYAPELAVTGGTPAPEGIVNMLGRTFTETRLVSLFIITFPAIALSERFGLQERAASVIQRIRAASVGRLQIVYQLFRVLVGALGIRLNEDAPHNSRCIRCDTCDGFPCLLHAKSDAQVLCVDPALQHPNVTLLTNAYVSRLQTSASGREVTSVDVRRNGKDECYSGDVVVVSCGAINSAALLLRSQNEAHPHGLANGSDMGHVNSILLALSKCANPTVFQKTLALNDFYFGSPEWDFPMGHISFVGKLDAATLAAGAPAIAPGFTLELMAKHSLDFWLTSEDLPDPNNRVTLDRAGKIQLSYTPNNDHGHKRLIAKLESLLQGHASCAHHGHGCHQGLFSRNLFIGQRIPLAGVAHQNGTLRFGRDPRTSVLDVTCRAHEVDNLYVVDGSFFPSSGAVNPALTIIANALRVGDHLIERMG